MDRSTSLAFDKFKKRSLDKRAKRIARTANERENDKKNAAKNAKNKREQGANNVGREGAKMVQSSAQFKSNSDFEDRLHAGEGSSGGMMTSKRQVEFCISQKSPEHAVSKAIKKDCFPRVEKPGRCVCNDIFINRWATSLFR